MTLRKTAPWRVGKYHPSETGDLPWYACDRGGWFGKGLPGRSFKTHTEAINYATFMAILLGAMK
jgi:hypothetical protein